MAITVDEVRKHYDSVPYSSHSYMHSAPEQLAAVARLFGHAAPAVGTARVLELGGASGGNLIPTALRHPGVQATGVELSGVQVDLGLEHVRRLGLTNVRLLQADLADLPDGALGEYDYIVCHGLYSWVPPHVQDAMLGLCARHLAPGGVAYVSYNTYPGWKSKELIRDAMLLHGRNRATPAEQIAYAKGMVGFLRQVARKGGVLAAALDENLPFLRDMGDHYLAHEWLEPYNLPCYFQQFLERAGGHGLAYLGEAQPAMMDPANYGNEIADTLYRAFAHDQATMEQYLDYAVDRGFRQTLLVRTTDAARISHRIDRGVFRGMHFAARLPCVQGATRFDGSVQGYGSDGRATISTALDAVKHALESLTRAWPGTVSREALIAGASASAPAGAPVEKAIDELLEFLVRRGLARIRLEPVAAAAADDPRPQVDPAVARMVSALPAHEVHVANLWHDSVDVTDDDRQLVPWLDGTRDRNALAQALEPHWGGGQALLARIDAALARLQAAALLRRPAT